MRNGDSTYDVGYRDGFSAGVEHYKKFTKSPEFARGVMPNYDPLGEKAAADVVLVSREACAQAIANEESPDYEHGLMEAGWEDAKVHFQEVLRALPPHGTKE